MAFSGTGTDLDPYIVTTEAQLIDIRNYPGSSFKLGADIALAADWVPISAWNGTIDGDLHSIKNFNCTVLGGHCGFIVQHNGPVTIKNLAMYGGSTGIVTTSSYYCGYLLAVQATYDVLIQDCLVVGKYTPGGDRGAGVVGITQSATTTLSRVVAQCTRVNAGRGNSLIYKYSGTLYASSSYFNKTLGVVTSTYGGETGLTSAQMADPANFPALDFVTTWRHTNGVYPELRGEVAVPQSSTRRPIVFICT